MSDIAISKRINWVDWAKIVGMYFIVYGHFMPKNLSPFIYSFSVPLFFIVSGYLIGEKQLTFKESATKAWHQLIFPLICILVVNYPFMLMKYHWTIDYTTTVLPITNTVIGMNEPALGGMWYVYDLILIRVFMQTTSLRWQHVMFVLSLIMMMLLGTIDNLNAGAYVSIWGGYVFMYIGRMFRKEESKFTPPHLTSVYIAIALIVLFFGSSYNGAYFMYNSDCGNSPLLALVLAIIGSWAIIQICKKLPRCPQILLNVNIGALWILGFHAKFIRYMPHFVPTLKDSEFLQAIVSLAILMAFIPFTMLLKKYAPALLGRK